MSEQGEVADIRTQVLVLGAGPGGYTAAFRAADLGKQVVLVEYPRPGLYAVAFVTAPVPPDFGPKLAADSQESNFVSLFVPTTPNPTSGYLVVVKQVDLTPMDMTVEEGVKLVISGGLLTPIHLLSPAQRPIQVTQDLAGFWQRTYQEVKKELKGRYPKHYWPDDPYQAQATGRIKPRGKGN